MPTISIIVPVYNVEKYLAYCIDSIRMQSMRDIEIICVNDGSTDRSAELLRMAAAVDDRIVVIDQPNGGLSAARNTGINAARGTYIMFVDSDDMIMRNACETVLENFEKTQADIITFGAKCFPKHQANEWLKECLRPRDVEYDGFNIDILFKEKSRPYVWRSAFKREFLKRENLLFREDVRYGEDQVFHFMSYPRSKKTVFISDRLYGYRLARKDSMTAESAQVKQKRISDHLFLIDCILKDWETNSWLSEYLPEMLQWMVDFVIFEILNLKNPYKTQFLRETKELFARYFPLETIDRVDKQSRVLVQVLLDTSDTDLFEQRTRKILSKYDINRWGYFYHLRITLNQFFHTPPFKALWSGLRHILPTPTASMQFYIEELSSVEQERQELLNSLTLLIAEHQAISGDNHQI